MAEPVQRVSNFSQHLEELKTAAELGWDYFVYACQKTREVIGDFFFKEPVVENLNIDFFAQKIFPSKELEEFVPLTVTGDGSCFFRSISLLVNGDETKHVEIRVRCVIELAVHSGYYLADEELFDRIVAQERLVGIVRSNNSGPMDASLIAEVYKAEVMKSCQLFEYASMWHLQAVGAVVRRKIRSVYPETTPEVRQYFQILITPRAFEEKPPLAVLWSRAGPVENLRDFVPNHFVPLVSRNMIYLSVQENKFPCPHPNCKGKNDWFVDISSHYRRTHNCDVNMDEVREERRLRNENAALVRVFLISSKVIGGEMFTVKYASGSIIFRDISFFNAALKVAFVLLSGDKLTSYSSEHYQNITVLSRGTTKVFQAWKVKSSAGLDLPEIECLRSTVEHVEEVVTSSSSNFSTSTMSSNVSTSTMSSNVSTSTMSAVLDRLHVSHPPASQQDPGYNDSIIEQLEVILEKEWGYTELRAEQREAITFVLQGKDCFVTLPTGGGKSLIYMLPAYKFHGVTIVVSPLKSLVEDQLQACTTQNIGASALHGDLSDSERQGIYMCLKQPVCPFKILYVLPEIIEKDRTFFNILTALYSRNKLNLFVVDEAHCVSMWGHEFRDSYLKLSELRKSFPNVPLLMLTATASKDTRNDVISILGAKNSKLILSPMDRGNIFYEVRQKNATCIDDLAALIKDEGSSLVFCSTRKECEDLSPKLEARGIKSKCYHGGMEDGIRKHRQTLWMNNDLQCLVCTCAFGMGIDKKDVRLVVHYVLPQSMEDFYQESGRAGRDGKTSKSVVYFVPHNQIFHVRNIFGKMNVNRAYATQRLASFQKVMYYCFQRGDCRRKLMLEYFNEQCVCQSNCDVCASGKRFATKNVGEFARNAIACVQRVSDCAGRVKYPLTYFARILTGKKVKEEHQSLQEYGCLKRTTDEGEYLLRILVASDVLREIPPEETARNKNAVYLTLGTRFADCLNGTCVLSYKTQTSI